MSLYLDENESFSMQANVEASGEQRIVLSGYLVQHRSDGTYVAPLIPQLFYGADGSQLQTWRQDLSAGSQTILSRSGGSPKVPREDLAWRKIIETERTPILTPAPTLATPNLWWLVGGLAVAGALYAIYKVLK